MSSNTQRTEQLVELLDRRILVLDGAMGTAIQTLNLTAEDFGGPDLEGCNEYLVITRPQLIQSIHEGYLKAGCDIVETNTFGGTPLVLNEYGLGSQAHEINLNAAQIARRAADRYSTPEKPRFVAGAIGPTTKAISVTGGVTFEELQDQFYLQAKALVEGGVDYLLLETCQDTRNIKAGILGIERLFAELGKRIPIAVSGTIEPMGTMLAGQSVEALYASLAHLDLLYLGLNCATGPEFMTEHIRSLAKLSKFRVACVPNAGLPDENGCYLENPEMVAQVLKRFVENDWVNLVGGCCGTHEGHIQALSELVAKAEPRKPQVVRTSFLSGVDFLEITDEMRPVIVGERTNVIGSKKFKTLINEGKFEEASEVARAQIKGGAQIVDVCLANPDRDELQDMRRFLEQAVKKLRAPFMVDSTDAQVTELALTYCQGKAIINSINLEDGEERFEKVAPMAKKYGAALVVGTIDDDPAQGMGITRARKLEIAERSYDLLTKKYGILPHDIYWDPLVFPCGTGDAQYVGSATETVEGIRLIKQRFPETRTVLGISNVSFGLPNAGREVLNSVFLYHCVQAGLDLAIVNSEKLERYASIPEEERRLAENLLFPRTGSNTSQDAIQDPIAEFAAHFRTKKETGKKKVELPLMDRLPRYIIEGSKDGLTEDLAIALKEMKPLEIINGPLMKGMDEVGKLFNSNQLIVAEVLQSAESMKTAVAYLEPYMEKSESAQRGKMVLATVKGDVHDIGKNLVDIIFSNNGFQVINLGIKVPSEQLIKAIRDHKPELVGLSGLLVKSAQQMVLTAEDFAKSGVSTPILVGGAALTSNFVDKQIAKAYTTGTVAYARDAMSGLELAKTIVNPENFKKFKAELEAKRVQKREEAEAPKVALVGPVRARPNPVSVLSEFPKPPDFEKHVLRTTPIEQIWNFINPLMLYCRYFGIKGSSARLIEKAAHELKAKQELKEKDPKAYQIWEIIQEVKEEYRHTETMRPAAVYQFFKVASDGDSLHLYDEKAKRPNGSLLCSLNFPRQEKEGGLCLSDYAIPKSLDRLDDTVAFFVVTVGHHIRELAEKLKEKGDYLKAHIVQALAIESAEAYAELLHSQIRHAWGFPDEPNMTMMQRFQAKYRGKRYSFGYPACPRLDDQAVIWKLLDPNDIGVQLTDGFMMDPEASVSAIVFHHPAAIYFSVGNQAEFNE